MVKFCPFILKILSRNEIMISTKGCNSVANLQKNDSLQVKPKVDPINVHVYTKFVKFCLFIFKILSRNEILTSIKGCKSIANLPKIMFYNPNIDLITVIKHTKFG